MNNVMQIAKLLMLVSAIIFSSTLRAAMEMDDNPVLAKVMLDRLELRVTDGSDVLNWEGQGWLGTDLNKLWIKMEGERRGSVTEDAEIQALYSRAIAPFWDVQIGARRDFQPTSAPGSDRTWGVIGLQGLAPYFFEINSALFVGESGRTGLRLEAEYELLFTQRLILTPAVEINFYGQNDVDTGTGSGLSDIEAGLRLRYEIRREFAPYIGVNWNRKYGNSADFADAEKNDVEDVQWVLGVRAWF